MGRTFRLCGATGVMAMVLLCGTMTGPPNAQRIGCRTGRSGNYQSVRLISGEIGPLMAVWMEIIEELSRFSNRYLIQTERVTFQFLFFAGYLQYAAVFYPIVSIVDIIKCVLHLFRGDIGQKT